MKKLLILLSVFILSACAGTESRPTIPLIPEVYQPAFNKIALEVSRNTVVTAIGATAKNCEFLKEFSEPFQEFVKKLDVDVLSIKSIDIWNMIKASFTGVGEAFTEVEKKCLELKSRFEADRDILKRFNALAGLIGLLGQRQDQLWGFTAQNTYILQALAADVEKIKTTFRIN